MSYMDSNLYTRYQLLEGKAADKAKQLGLKYAGWGKWANKSGKVVAVTKQDKLVPISGTYLTKGKLGLKPDKKPKKKLTPKQKFNKFQKKSSKLASTMVDFQYLYDKIQDTIVNSHWLGTSNDVAPVTNKIVDGIKKKGKVGIDDLSNIVFEKDFTNLTGGSQKVILQIHDVLPKNLKTKKKLTKKKATTSPVKTKIPPKALNNYKQLVKAIQPAYNNNTEVIKHLGSLLLLKSEYDDALSIQDVYGNIFDAFYHNGIPQAKKIAKNALNALSTLSQDDVEALLTLHDVGGMISKKSKPNSTIESDHILAHKTLITGEVVKKVTSVFSSMFEPKELSANIKMEREMKDDAIDKAKTWRSKIPLEDFRKLNYITNEWQQDSQYHESPAKKKRRNKFLNDIMTRNPPAVIKTKNPIYRGLSLSQGKAEQFLKAIKVGKTLRLPPSGFSGSATLARDFASGETGVLIKLFPSKKNELHGMHLAYQREALPRELSDLNLPLGKKQLKRPTIEDFPVILSKSGRQKMLSQAEYEFGIFKHWTYPDDSKFRHDLDFPTTPSNFNHEQEIITNGNALTKVKKVTKLYEQDKVLYIIELENLGLIRSKPAAKIKDHYNPLLREDEFEKLMNTSQYTDDTSEFEKKMNTSIHFASSAAEKASELGYKYKGFGYWEKDGVVVARTIKGQLVPMTKKNAQRED